MVGIEDRKRKPVGGSRWRAVIGAFNPTTLLYKLPVATSHTHTSPRSFPVTTKFPSYSTAIAVTGLSWPADTHFLPSREPSPSPIVIGTFRPSEPKSLCDVLDGAG